METSQIGIRLNYGLFPPVSIFYYRIHFHMFYTFSVFIVLDFCLELVAAVWSHDFDYTTICLKRSFSLEKYIRNKIGFV